MRMKTNRGFRMSRMYRDSDGDKVPDVLDCQPHNPHKQGIIHDMKMKLYRRQKEKLEEKERMAREEHHAKKEIRAREDRISKYKTGRTLTERRAARREKVKSWAKKAGSSTLNFVDSATKPQPTRKKKSKRKYSKSRRHQGSVVDFRFM